MERIELILTLIYGVVSLVAAIIAWVKAIKNGNTAKAEKARNAIFAEIKRLVAEAETTYKETNIMLKNVGSSAGSLKKDYVVTAIKAFCLENGFPWNATEMDKAIEDEVAYTKTVNAKE